MRVRVEGEGQREGLDLRRPSVRVGVIVREGGSGSNTALVEFPSFREVSRKPRISGPFPRHFPAADVGSEWPEAWFPRGMGRDLRTTGATREFGALAALPHRVKIEGVAECPFPRVVGAPGDADGALGESDSAQGLTRTL